MHQHEAHRLAIAARRTETGEFERCLDEVVRHRPLLPMRKGVRLMKHCREKSAVGCGHTLSPFAIPPPPIVTLGTGNAIGTPYLTE
jgi:hypothetical protein